VNDCVDGQDSTPCSMMSSIGEAPMALLRSVSPRTKAVPICRMFMQEFAAVTVTPRVTVFTNCRH
jgi:hypothetical protein